MSWLRTLRCWWAGVKLRRLQHERQEVEEEIVEALQAFDHDTATALARFHDELTQDIWACIKTIKLNS